MIRNVGIALTILFGGLYMIVQNPLLGNIFRLCAFIGFAFTLINYLQKGGKVESIELERDQENIIINYYTAGSKKREELYEIQTIDTVNSKTAAPIFKMIPRDDCIQFDISFTDSSKILSLFRYQGRDLYLSKSDAQKVDEFVDQHLKNISQS